MIIFEDNKHIVNFGFGDVGILPSLNLLNEGMLYFIRIPNGEGKPGEILSPEELGVTMENVVSLSDVIFMFEDIDDVDNVINVLKDVKKMMLGNSQK